MGRLLRPKLIHAAVVTHANAKIAAAMRANATTVRVTPASARIASAATAVVLSAALSSGYALLVIGTTPRRTGRWGVCLRPAIQLPRASRTRYSQRCPGPRRRNSAAKKGRAQKRAFRPVRLLFDIAGRQVDEAAPSSLNSRRASFTIDHAD